MWTRNSLWLKRTWMKRPPFSVQSVETENRTLMCRCLRQVPELGVNIASNDHIVRWLYYFGVEIVLRLRGAAYTSITNKQQCFSRLLVTCTNSFNRTIHKRLLIGIQSNRARPDHMIKVIATLAWPRVFETGSPDTWRATDEMKLYLCYEEWSRKGDRVCVFPRHGIRLFKMF